MEKELEKIHAKLDLILSLLGTVKVRVEEDKHKPPVYGNNKGGKITK